ncbi:MAG: hypothetical protein AAB520_03365 [Patescibacteria group bacterium]
MKNKFITEILISTILIVLLILLLDPFMILMTTPVQMITIAAVLIIFISFCVFVWKENSRDEREQLHKQIASRFAYLSGASILIIAIITQSLNHSLDPWIVIALIVMILAKVAGSLYAKNKY